MKSTIIAVLLCLSFVFDSFAQTQNVGIGTDKPDSSALLHLESIDKGFLIPRSDTTAIANPADGLLIYMPINNMFWYFNGTTNSWKTFDGLHGRDTTLWKLNANSIYRSSGNVGIGTSAPNAKLDVSGSIKVGGGSIFTQMQGGKADIGASGGQLIVILAVAFSNPFLNPPKVICSASAQPGTIFDDSFNVTTRQITTTQFTMIINRTDGQAWGQDLDVHWFAFD